MKSIMTPKELAEKRKKENEDLLARAKKGESISRCDTAATWWPPRPIIKKDLANRLQETMKKS